MITKILVALDIADEASSAHLLKTASDLSKLHSAELHALMVVPTYRMPLVGSYFEPKDEEAMLRRAKEAFLSFLTDKAPEEQQVKGHIAHGTIYDEINRVAESLGCQLIVLGAHRPELSDYLLGPNAARVVRHARQSVYVVRDDTE